MKAGATFDQSNSEIETPYNTQVSQVNSTERNFRYTNPVRRFSPADIKSMIDTHETNTTFSVSDLDGTGIVSGAEQIKALDFVDLSSNQTITGIKTFQGSGIISSSAITITTAHNQTLLH